MQKALSAIAIKLDQIFNRLYSSDYNPLYRSGTIAIGLLTIVIVSGTYLTFFYRLGEPYESILALQQSPWTGRWIRALHRHASDALIFAVVAHVLRMYLQGKTWGPRTLAWISGAVLFLFMLISGWTGFIMVWDVQGQAVAIGLGKVLDSIGIFSDPFGRAFSGVEHPPSSFFFLNLFIHIIVPLAMIFGLWIHTSKMARATWLPQKQLFRGMIATLVAFSILWPAPLAEKANLLKVLGQYPLDWFYNLGIPLTHQHPRATFWGSVILTVLFCLIPWLTKPKPEAQPAPSENDHKNCQGCTQCVKDCPYEAIHMVPRTLGQGSAEVAEVKPWLCVSCGLCSASCLPFTMGPPDRKAGDQFKMARKFLTDLRSKGQNTKEQVLIVGCGFQGNVLSHLQEFVTKNTGFQIYPANCTGTLHASVYGHLAQSFSSVAIVNCPPRNCTNKDAAQLLTARLAGELEPTFPQDAQRERTHLLPTGDGEESILFTRLLEIRDGKPLTPTKSKTKVATAVAASFAILFGLSWLTNIPYGQATGSSSLRLSFRLTGQTEKICQKRTQEALAKQLKHMQTPEMCEVRPIPYKMNLSINNKTIISRQVIAGGLHHDRPIYIDQDISVIPGEHLINIEFSPVDASATAKSFQLQKNIVFLPEQVVLIYIPPNQSELLIKGEPK